MRLLNLINPRRRLVRWPLKTLILLVGVFLVLFPRVDRFLDQLRLPLNRNVLINPESSALRPMVDEFDGLRNPEWNERDMLQQLERYVYGKIRYTFDWDLWGNVDYFPSVEEAVMMGREDCDGQALVFASMARRYGYDAHLVGNLSHVWVSTNLGESMGPGKSKAFTMSEDRVKFNWKAIADLPRELSIGISLFPLGREILLVLLVWILMLGRDVQMHRAGVWLFALMFGLMLVREGGCMKTREFTTAMVGFGTWAVALAAMCVQGRWFASSRSLTRPFDA